MPNKVARAAFKEKGAVGLKARELIEKAAKTLDMALQSARSEGLLC
jgi:hypothetical protein